MEDSEAAILECLKDFDDRSKTWIYFADKPLDKKQSEDVQSKIDQFCREWKAHGNPVMARGFFLQNQIILLIVDESKSGITGCSADSSVRFVQEIGNTYGLDFFDRQRITAWKDGNIQRVAIDDVLSSLRKEDLVFNPFYRDLGEIRDGFIVPLEDSKYSRIIAQIN